MANQDFTLDIFCLKRSISFISSHKKISDLSTAELSFLTRALNIYYNFEETANKKPVDTNIKDVKSLLESKLADNLTNIVSYLEKQSGQTSEPEKVSKQRAESDQNNIPAELETMVALYKQHQADKLNSDRELPISDTIKRLRKSWLEKEKQRLIYQNSDKLRQEQLDKEREVFYRQNINSKKTYQETIANTKKAAERILLTDASLKKLSSQQYQEAVENLIYGIQTGAINLDKNNDIYTAIELIKKDFLGEKVLISKVDDLIQEESRNNEIDPYQDTETQYKTKTIHAEQEIFNRYDLETKSFVNKIDKVLDLDIDIKQAKEDSVRALETLNRAIPNPRLLLEISEIDKHKNELEEAIYTDTLKINENKRLSGSTDRIQLRPNSDGLSSRTSGLISQTGGNKNISAGAIDLYSRGITPQKLNEIISLPGSKTAEILAKNSTLRKQIEFQLKQIQSSQLGQGISKGLEKLKPLSDSYYRLSGTVQKVLDPVGTARSYIGREAGKSVGQYLIKSGGSAFAQKTGQYILKDGLQAGVKNLVKDGTKKLLIKGAEWAAVKLGISLTAESLNAIAPGLGLVVDIVVQIGLWVAEKTYIAIRDKWRELFNYDEKEAKENRRAILIGLAAAGATGAALLGVSQSGIRGFTIATKAAVISAIGIIWLSIATIAVFLSLTFLVTPLLTTFVQFDAEKKVTYTENEVIESGPTNCANMPWPFAGKHYITQGPRNTSCTHSGSIAESADFGMNTGTPILSMTSGTVVDAIRSDTGYGNHVKIQATTDNGKSFLIIYAHFSVLRVGKGAKVEKGTVLGLSGNSGYSTGPHLHLGYVGIEYNSCPAGNHKIKENCCSTSTCNQP